MGAFERSRFLAERVVDLFLHFAVIRGVMNHQRAVTAFIHVWQTPAVAVLDVQNQVIPRHDVTIASHFSLRMRVTAFVGIAIASQSPSSVCWLWIMVTARFVFFSR